METLIDVGLVLSLFWLACMVVGLAMAAYDWLVER